MELLEDLIDSGSTPEAVCSERPDLLPAVREQWEQCRRIDAKINALFGSSEGSDSGQMAFPPTGISLPNIPGYELIDVLGRGGMGIVYRARHVRLGRIIALKMVLSGAHASGVERARLLREAQAVAGLRHANVVQVYDVGEFEGCPYFTMELVEGKSLAENLGGVPQSATRATTMLITLADAIESAHQSGIIHRDLKPANVLLTADGTLKISDFGLARHVQGEDLLTANGVRLGTPSYMAPEQASARSDAVGPTIDVYSLGAILYEMLTGRPPFRGESAAETERQLLTEDPVPPSRLNARAPRDLETICLMCLRKDPRRRYPTAAALAQDLRRFHRREPISARKTGAAERSIKWVRRHPNISWVVLGATIIAAALLVGTVCLVWQHEATVKVVQVQLRDVIRFQEQSSWKEADAALDRASLRLGESGPAQLRRQIDQARRDSALAARLDAICLNHAGSTGGVLNIDLTDQNYQAAFADFGIGAPADDPAAVAQRVLASTIHNALVAALYDWTLGPTDKAKWLWQVICRADGDPTGWRDRVRTTPIWNDPNALASAAENAPVAEQSVPFLLAVASQLKALGKGNVLFLTRVQAAHPQDFWANLTLADELKQSTGLPESIRFYQAAIALRPGAAIARNNFGMALANMDRKEESIAQYQRALELDPDALPSLENFGIESAMAGHYPQAIRALQESLRRSPDNAYLNWMLGRCLECSGHLLVAVDHYRRAVELDPNLEGAQKSLRSSLTSLGRDDDALDAWRESLKRRPAEHDPWDGYAEYCVFLRRENDYVNARVALLDRFGDSNDPSVCERVGRACLLRPAPGDQLQRATALIDRAISLDRAKPTGYAHYYQFAKALAEYRNEHFDAAIAITTGVAADVLGPSPRMVLAMSQFRLGHVALARATLSQAVAGYDWRPESIDSNDFWLYQALRREAEETVLPVSEPRNNPSAK